jgi:hypothetical protein
MGLLRTCTLAGAYSSVSLASVLQAPGIGPVSAFWSRYKYFMLPRAPQDSGSGPLSLLAPMLQKYIAVRLAHAGSGPAMLFAWRSIHCRLLRPFQDTGSGPLKLLLLRNLATDRPGVKHDRVSHVHTARGKLTT